MAELTSIVFPFFDRELKADSSEKVSPTTGSSQMVKGLGPTSSKVSVKQEPDVGTAAASPAVIPKLRIKNDSLERTVVSQTVSTTTVHVSEFRTFIFIMCFLETVCY